MHHPTQPIHPDARGFVNGDASRFSGSRLLAALVVGLSLAGPAPAADPAPTAAGKTRYDKERAVCMTGKSNQDQATCLKEAGAALDESRRGNLNDADADYRKNALIRCRALPQKDQADCTARIEGDGKVTGTAAQGGIIRERVTRETGATPASAAASTAR